MFILQDIEHCHQNFQNWLIIDFIIVNSKNVILHQYIKQMAEICLGAFQKLLEILLIPSLNSISDFFKSLKQQLLDSNI